MLFKQVRKILNIFWTDQELMVNCLFVYQEFDSIELWPKILFQIELQQEVREGFGLQVEAELAEDVEEEDQLRVFVSEVPRGGLAHRRGLQVGDEILVLNSRVVSELDMVYVEQVLHTDLSITLTVRSCRLQRPPNTTAPNKHADVYIENMMCPPPPSQARLTEQTLDELIVPAPMWGENHNVLKQYLYNRTF